MFDDAKIVSSVCNIVLTGRDMGTGNRVPLTSVPYHAIENYFAKLIQAGNKVAIVEQTSEEAASGPAGKGLMEREVVRVVNSLRRMILAQKKIPPVSQGRSSFPAATTLLIKALEIRHQFSVALRNESGASKTSAVSSECSERFC
jgi:hypothetical protein